ncbi:MAG: preprotein translocase subunit SecE [Anaerolineae bacterium]|nr:preprotein translocase subunit SecE [Chloroflexota bacterium]MBN8635295.1 preprotein translocase subunit SecE [Anaerolineae bacterium]
MSADKTVGDQKEGRQPRRLSLGLQRKADASASTGKARVISNAPTKKPVKTEVEEPEQKPREGNFLTRLPGDLREYIEGVRSELRKVTWPTREEAIRLTIIVIVALIVTALVLGAVVLLYTELFRIGLDSPVVLIAFMLIAAVVGVVINRSQNRPTGYRR